MSFRYGKKDKLKSKKHIEQLFAEGKAVTVYPLRLVYLKTEFNDDSILKILYLAINRVAKKWTMPIRDWKAALNQFVILFGDRVPI